MIRFIFIVHSVPVVYHPVLSKNGVSIHQYRYDGNFGPSGKEIAALDFVEVRKKNINIHALMSFVDAFRERIINSGLSFSFVLRYLSCSLQDHRRSPSHYKLMLLRE
jgi:hypothetical protein